MGQFKQIVGLTAWLVVVLGWSSHVAGQDSATPPAQWVEARVETAQSALARSEAGSLVWRSIEAHGGLARWYSNGPIEFRFTYAPVAGRPPIDTLQVVDTWSSRAVHWSPSDPGAGFGWDGARAWTVGGDLGVNARFWALTPYYFVGVPFVLADPGVVLTLDGEETFEGTTYVRVRAIFEAGIGDAPDDYYILLIDPATGRTGGVRYIVSYPGFFPDGGHTPEKLMVYDGEQTIDGVMLPMSFRTFDAEGTLVTNTTLSLVSFRPEATQPRFDAPEGATFQEGY